MGNQNFSSFVNKIIEIGMDSANANRVINPRVRYVTADKFESSTGSDRKPEPKAQEMTPPPAFKAVEPSPVRKPPAAPPSTEHAALRIDLTDQNLLNGFVMSEVLGRPKCFRMGRRHAGR